MRGTSNGQFRCGYWEFLCRKYAAKARSIRRPLTRCFCRHWAYSSAVSARVYLEEDGFFCLLLGSRDGAWTNRKIEAHHCFYFEKSPRHHEAAGASSVEHALENPLRDHVDRVTRDGGERDLAMGLR
jgi:hypothetical protein